MRLDPDLLLFFQGRGEHIKIISKVCNEASCRSLTNYYCGFGSEEREWTEEARGEAHFRKVLIRDHANGEHNIVVAN